MTEPAIPRLAWKDVVSVGCALVGAVVIVGGKVRDDGTREARIADNTRRIESLEHMLPDQQKTLTAILERTARIETKQDMIASVAGAKR